MYNRYPYRFGRPAAPRRANRSQRIPVRQAINGEPNAHLEPDLQAARAEQMRRDAANDDRPTTKKPVDPTIGNGQAEPALQIENGPGSTEPATDHFDWKQKALQLQAEMDNFRKRQTRRAAEAIAQERERLLKEVLPVADNLARALAHADQPENDSESLHQGVALTQRQLMRVLESEGVSRLETIGQPFDPNWHEAIGTIPAEAEAGTVVQEVEAGYTFGDKLLRPARVVVAA